MHVRERKNLETIQFKSLQFMYVKLLKMLERVRRSVKAKEKNQTEQNVSFNPATRI